RTPPPPPRHALVIASPPHRSLRRRRTLRSASVGDRPTLHGRVHPIPRQHRGDLHRERALYRGPFPRSLLVPILVSRFPLRALLPTAPPIARGGPRTDRRGRPAGRSDRRG